MYLFFQRETRFCRALFCENRRRKSATFSLIGSRTSVKFMKHEEVDTYSNIKYFCPHKPNTNITDTSMSLTIAEESTRHRRTAKFTHLQ